MNLSFSEPFLDNSPVPRKISLPKDEIEICRRLRQFREFTGIARTVFAEKASIDDSALVRVEHQRMPLRYSLYQAIHKAFAVNPQWLRDNTGTLETGFFIDDSEYVAQIASNALFSDVYDRFLIGQMRIMANGAVLSVQSVTADLAIVTREANAGRLLGVPSKMIKAFIAASNESQKAFTGMLHGRAPEKKEAEPDSQPTVDNEKQPDINADVQSIRNYGQLLNRLREMTKQRGTKAALARQFKVTRQAVDKWLSGESKPSADIAIELQYWKPEQPKNKML